MVELRIESEETEYNRVAIDILSITQRYSAIWCLKTTNLHGHESVYWLYPNSIVIITEDVMTIETGFIFHHIDLKVEMPCSVSNYNTVKSVYY